MKSFALACFAAAFVNGAELVKYGEGNYSNPAPGPSHLTTWGHGHYEPGNISRFLGHESTVRGNDDWAWGPNGYAQPLNQNDGVHNWDDAGDAYVCHSCGGHGCGHCGGYGHHHKRAKFGYHGHTLRKGFGVGHWHNYLGDKQRSSYNKYGHGIGSRYSQRYSNGFGDRYGITAGARYGLAHLWGMYNGYGRGNPSSKGSVMGYGYDSNATTPLRTESYYSEGKY